MISAIATLFRISDPRPWISTEELFMSVISMTDLDLAGKRVLIRQDLNVPVQKWRS